MVEVQDVRGAAYKAHVDDLRDLPAFPSLMQRVMNLVVEEETDIEELAEAILLDQSITAKILKVVNSAFYGFHRQIDSVQDAIVILGLSEIRALVMAVSVLKIFPARITRFDRKAFWAHSIAAGCGTESVCAAARGADPAAFVAGLLHDIGKNIMAQHFRREWEQALDQIETMGSRDCDAEMNVFGVDHGEIGYWVVERWQLPTRITEAVRYHDCPQRATEAPELVAAVHIANALVRRNAIGYTPDRLAPQIEPAALERLGLSDSAIAECEDAIRKRYERLRGALD